MEDYDNEGFKGGKGGGSSVGKSIAGNSGILGVVGGTTVCTPSDQTWFCFFQRLMSYISWAIFVIALVFVVYWIGKAYFGSRGGRRRGGR